ncbi:MAG: metallophosphoesterase [Fibromonadales bacterium]|nr:metallophosphoesterase [Fibromonadales bacterium]
MFSYFPYVFVIVFFLSILGYAWWRFRFVFKRKYRYLGALLFVICFAVNFFQRAVSNDIIAGIMQAIGSFSTVFLANWVFFCLFWDLYLGIRRILGKKSIANKRLRMRREPALASAVALLTVAFFLVGAPSQSRFKVTTVNEKLDTTPKKTLRIALFSDIHFDNLFQKNKLERLVDSLRVLQPNAIFFAGDLADISADKLQKKGFDSLFKQISAPLGFFAVVGNHEGFSISEEHSTVEWLKSLGNVVLLMDSTACNEYFCLTGRIDHSYAKKIQKNRTLLKELMPENNSVPWFLLDHQPRGLDKQDTGLSRLPNFAMSGHTHAGQFFPATIVIRFLWSLVYGFGNLSGIPWFVTSGIGQWMPIRTFTRNELVLFVFE